ncbi:penicillin-binding protein activator [Gammaproteobacteria bacterium]
MTIRKYRSLAVAISITLFLTGCATTPGDESATNATSPVDVVFPTDLQTVIVHLVDDLLNSHAIGNHQPLIAFNEVIDKTNTHLDTKGISDQIRTQLLNSGKVRLVADRKDDNNEGSGYSSDNKNGEGHFRFQDNGHPPSSKFHRKKATNYRLIGVIHDTPFKKYNIQEQYYRMVLSLLDMNSEELIWTDEKENVERGSSQ